MRITRRNFVNLSLLSAASVACSQQLNTPSTLPPEPKIVALEWVYVENLLALGIQPTGVADIAGYKQYVNIAPKLANSVIEVGTRQEPNLEAIAQIKPDLIVGVKQRHESIYQTLSAIAKTLLFDSYPKLETSQLVQMQQNFLALAQACRKTTQAQSVLNTMQAAFSDAAKKLSAANLAGNSFVLCQFVPELRLFTDNSMAVQILSQIGLKNLWQGNLEQFGFNTVGVEALASVESAHFLYIPQSEAQLQQLQANPVWQSLEFVQQQRTYSLGQDTWLFGGPLSAQVLVDKAIATLT